MNYSEMLFNRDEKIIKIIEEKDKEIEKYQLELEKADSITQSCIFQGKQESEISFRNCLNKMTKYKTTLDKIKEYIKENACYDKDIKQCCRDLLTDECDYVLDLLEEIEKKDS